jgi:hypothetical protein
MKGLTSTEKAPRISENIERAPAPGASSRGHPTHDIEHIFKRLGLTLAEGSANKDRAVRFVLIKVHKTDDLLRRNHPPAISASSEPQ